MPRDITSTVPPRLSTRNYNPYPKTKAVALPSLEVQSQVVASSTTADNSSASESSTGCPTDEELHILCEQDHYVTVLYTLIPDSLLPEATRLKHLRDGCGPVEVLHLEGPEVHAQRFVDFYMKCKADRPFFNAIRDILMNRAPPLPPSMLAGNTVAVKDSGSGSPGQADAETAPEATQTMCQCTTKPAENSWDPEKHPDAITKVTVEGPLPCPVGGCGATFPPEVQFGTMVNHLVASHKARITPSVEDEAIPCPAEDCKVTFASPAGCERDRKKTIARHLVVSHLKSRVYLCPKGDACARTSGSNLSYTNLYIARRHIANVCYKHGDIEVIAKSIVDKHVRSGGTPEEAATLIANATREHTKGDDIVQAIVKYCWPHYDPLVMADRIRENLGLPTEQL